MRKTALQLTLFGLLFSCRSSDAVTVPDNANAGMKAEDTSAPAARVIIQDEAQQASSVATHLKDTITIEGNFVIFLLPDSARFASYENEDENVYTADSDFGAGVSETIDSMKTAGKYKHIHYSTTEKRFIMVNGNEHSPSVIDRDTISYGVVLIAKDKPARTISFLHSGNYLSDIDDYFFNN
ncbi:MAG TPA: hypothetical protein VNR87_04310 [Flavisolibacter sp.]|nr:hypothetical protein [Flavisolibacter sp.]